MSMKVGIIIANSVDFTVYQSTSLGVSSIQRVNTLMSDGIFFIGPVKQFL